MSLASPPNPETIKQSRGHSGRIGGYRPRVGSVTEMGSELPVMNSRESSIVNSLSPSLNVRRIA